MVMFIIRTSGFLYCQLYKGNTLMQVTEGNTWIVFWIYCDDMRSGNIWTALVFYRVDTRFGKILFVLLIFGVM
jgi:hypothetical protein